VFGEPDHFDLEEFILKKEEITNELLTLQGRKGEIELWGNLCYPQKVVSLIAIALDQTFAVKLLMHFGYSLGTNNCR
jgi:hypothetical protein